MHTAGGRFDAPGYEAQHADIVAVGGMGSEADVAERAGYILNQAGDRADDIGDIATGLAAAVERQPL